MESGDDCVGNEDGFADSLLPSGEDNGVGWDSREEIPSLMSLILDTKMRSAIGRTKWNKNIGHVEGCDDCFVGCRVSGALDVGCRLPLF